MAKKGNKNNNRERERERENKLTLLSSKVSKL